jgi:hypothetical protein
MGGCLQEQMPPPANLHKVRQREIAEIAEIWEDID